MEDFTLPLTPSTIVAPSAPAPPLPPDQPNTTNCEPGLIWVGLDTCPPEPSPRASILYPSPSRGSDPWPHTNTSPEFVAATLNPGPAQISRTLCSSEIRRGAGTRLCSLPPPGGSTPEELEVNVPVAAPQYGVWNFYPTSTHHGSRDSREGEKLKFESCHPD